MMQRAQYHQPDIIEGRWVIGTRHRKRDWEVIVEPDFAAKRLVVVTAYPVWSGSRQQ